VMTAADLPPRTEQFSFAPYRHDSVTSTNSCTGSAASAHPLAEVVHMLAKRRKEGRAFPHSNDNAPQEVHVHVHDYEDFTSASACSYRVEAAVAANMSWKGEDRHCVFYNDEGTSFSSGYERIDTGVFCGVFDGHNGAAAAQYCSKGLFPHVLLEMTETLSADMRTKPDATAGTKCSEDKSLKAQSNVKDSAGALKIILEPCYKRAFEKAQEQFTRNGHPPTFYEVEIKRQDLMVSIKKEKTRSGTESCWAKIISGCFRGGRNKGLSKLSVSKTSRIPLGGIRPGGTTACILSIVRSLTSSAIASFRCNFVRSLIHF
jgi:hypothetical protein